MKWYEEEREVQMRKVNSMVKEFLHPALRMR